jgi:hypothetical protein
MSRGIKYIGMDVHKEAIVIAVLNGRQRESDHENHPGNQSQQPSRVSPRSLGRAACDLGRRNRGAGPRRELSCFPITVGASVAD